MRPNLPIDSFIGNSEGSPGELSICWWRSCFASSIVNAKFFVLFFGVLLFIISTGAAHTVVAFGVGTLSTALLRNALTGVRRLVGDQPAIPGCKKKKELAVRFLTRSLESGSRAVLRARWTMVLACIVRSSRSSSYLGGFASKVYLF